MILRSETEDIGVVPILRKGIRILENAVIKDTVKLRPLFLQCIDMTLRIIMLIMCIFCTFQKFIKDLPALPITRPRSLK